MSRRHTTTSIATGRHQITEHVFFNVSVLDAGTKIELIDRTTNRRFTIVLDGNVVTHRQVAKLDPDLYDEDILACRPTSPCTLFHPPEPSPLFPARRLTRQRSTSVTMQLTVQGRTRVVHVHAGYRIVGRHGVVVLFRVRTKLGDHDGLLRVLPAGMCMLESAMEGSSKLEPADWHRFVSLAEGAAFKVGGKDAFRLRFAELGFLDGLSLNPLPNLTGSPDLPA